MEIREQLLTLTEVRNLERVGFSSEEIARLFRFKERYQRGAYQEATAEFKRLAFVRWLYEQGRAALRATLLELRKLLERSHGPGERTHLLVERETLGFDQGSPLVLDLSLVAAASKQVGQPLADQVSEELLAQLEQATHLVR